MHETTDALEAGATQKIKNLVNNACQQTKAYKFGKLNQVGIETTAQNLLNSLKTIKDECKQLERSFDTVLDDLLKSESLLDSVQKLALNLVKKNIEHSSKDGDLDYESTTRLSNSFLDEESDFIGSDDQNGIGGKLGF